MKSYWCFIMIVVLSAVTVGYHLSWTIIVISHLIWLRVLAEKNRALLMLCLVLYCLFLLYSFISYKHISTSNISATESTFKVVFNEKIKIDGNILTTNAYVRNRKEKVVLSYIIPSSKEKQLLQSTLKIGLSCFVEGSVTQPESNRNEGMFNYQSYLRSSDIQWILNVSNWGKCEYKPTLKNSIPIARQWLLDRADKAFKGHAIAYAKALLLGNQQDFSSDVYQLYQRLGIVHILSISGLHVTLFILFLCFVCWRIGITRERTYLFLYICLPFYAGISGMSPPVVRAVLVALLVVFSKQKTLQLTFVDILSISFIACVCVHPAIILNVGFQLSYTACFSLVLSSKIFSYLKSPFLHSIFVSLLTTVISVPILSANFYEISIISLFSNIIFIPIFSFIILPLFFISFLFYFILPFLTPLFQFLTSHIIAYTEFLGHLIDSPLSTVTIGKPNQIELLICMLVTALFFYGLEVKSFRKTGITLFVFVYTIYFSLLYFHPFGSVSFIDVGQGDSIFIQLPRHRGTYLIDTGGTVTFGKKEDWQKRKNSKEVGKDTIVPFLKSKGIGTIDKLILTHGDTDHIGGAQAVLRSFHVKEIDISPRSYQETNMLKIVEYAQEHHILVNEVKAGNAWNTGQEQFQFLSPNDNMYEGNNDSLVLYAKIANKTWLFTGDIEASAEQQIVSTYHITSLDVLKVAHHGSKTSSSPAFIRSLQPKVAVISVGKHNLYKHPNQETLDTLKSNDVQLFRTDQNGEVSYKFFGYNGTFSSIFP